MDESYRPRLILLDDARECIQDYADKTRLCFD
jgi:hypothetical protein